MAAEFHVASTDETFVVEGASASTTVTFTIPSSSDAEGVGFELGEDAPRNAAGRAAQEERWRLEAQRLDARKHFSVRELLQQQKPAVTNAIEDYARVRALVDAIGHSPPAADDAEQSSTHTNRDILPSERPSLISSLTPELLEMVCEHAMPGQGPLVRAMHTRRPSVPPPSAFRVFVRVRPLHAAEVEGGEYSSLDDSARRHVVAHDARLARSGRRLSMVHKWYAADAVFSAALMSIS